MSVPGKSDSIQMHLRNLRAATLAALLCTIGAAGAHAADVAAYPGEIGARCGDLIRPAAAAAIDANSPADAARVGEYSVVICPRISGAQEFRIYRGDTLLEKGKDGAVSFVTRVTGFGRGADAKPGDDITGAGFPTVVMEGWSGAGDCCFTWFLYDLTPGKLRTIPPIVIGAGSLELERVNNFTGLVISALDDAFIGWRAEPAQSPLFEVILAYDKTEGRYRLAQAMTRRTPPNPPPLSDMAASLRVQIDPGKPTRGRVEWPYTAPVALWQNVLDLVYGGNSLQAGQLMEMAWDDAASRAVFWHEMIECQLPQSRFYADILEMNGWTRPAPATACKNWAPKR